MTEKFIKNFQDNFRSADIINPLIKGNQKLLQQNESKQQNLLKSRVENSEHEKKSRTEQKLIMKKEALPIWFCFGLQTT